MSWGSGVSVELFSSGNLLYPEELIKQISSTNYSISNRYAVPYSVPSTVRAEDDDWGVFFILKKSFNRPSIHPKHCLQAVVVFWPQKRLPS